MPGFGFGFGFETRTRIPDFLRYIPEPEKPDFKRVLIILKLIKSQNFYVIKA